MVRPVLRVFVIANLSLIKMLMFMNASFEVSIDSPKESIVIFLFLFFLVIGVILSLVVLEKKRDLYSKLLWEWKVNKSYEGFTLSGLVINGVHQDIARFNYLLSDDFLYLKKSFSLRSERFAVIIPKEKILVSKKKGKIEVTVDGRVKVEMHL